MRNEAGRGLRSGLQGGESGVRQQAEGAVLHSAACLRRRTVPRSVAEAGEACGRAVECERAMGKQPQQGNSPRANADADVHR